MKRTSIFRTLILAGLVVTTAVSAGTDIVKCIDAEGNVTLTDASCPDRAKTAVLVLGGTAPAATVADNDEDAATMAGEPATFEAVAAERYSAPRVARRELPVVRPFAKGMSRDVATLKAARQNLQMLDNASHAMRAQRIALQ